MKCSHPLGYTYHPPRGRGEGLQEPVEIVKKQCLLDMTGPLTQVLTETVLQDLTTNISTRMGKAHRTLSLTGTYKSWRILVKEKQFLFRVVTSHRFLILQCIIMNTDLLKLDSVSHREIMRRCKISEKGGYDWNTLYIGMKFPKNKQHFGTLAGCNNFILSSQAGAIYCQDPFCFQLPEAVLS